MRPLVPPPGVNRSRYYKLTEASHELSCPQFDGRVFLTVFPTSLCFQFSVVSLSHLGLVLLYIKQTCLILASWPRLSWLIIFDPVRDLCSSVLTVGLDDRCRCLPTGSEPVLFYSVLLYCYRNCKAGVIRTGT